MAPQIEKIIHHYVMPLMTLVSTVVAILAYISSKEVDQKYGSQQMEIKLQQKNIQILQNNIQQLNVKYDLTVKTIGTENNIQNNKANNPVIFSPTQNNN